MTVAVATTGGPSYASGSTINHTVTMPSGIVAGDLLLLFVGVKPDTSTVNTPAGWTKLGEYSGGGGTTGIDTGPTRVVVFYREATGSDSAPSVNITSTNVCWAYTVRLTKTGGAWDLAIAGGQDSTTGAAWSVTCGSNPGLQPGDLAIVASVIPTDVGVGAQFSGHGISATGVSAWSAFTELAEPQTNVGNDIAGFLFYGSPSSGTATAAPVVSSTASGTTTNVRGVSALVRVREGSTAQLGDGSLSIAPTASGTALVAALGAGSVTVAPTATGVGIKVQQGAGALTVTPSLSGTAGVDLELGTGSLTVTPAITGSAVAAAGAKLGDGSVTVAPTASGAGHTDVVATAAPLLVGPVLGGDGSHADAEWFASGQLTVVPAVSGLGYVITQPGRGSLLVAPIITARAVATPAGGFLMSAAQVADALVRWPDAKNIPEGQLAMLLEEAWAVCEAFLPHEIVSAPGYDPADVPAYVGANVLHARDIYTAGRREGGSSDVITGGEFAIRVRGLSTYVQQLLRPESGRAQVG